MLMVYKTINGKRAKWLKNNENMAKLDGICWFRFQHIIKHTIPPFLSNLNGIHDFICSFICWDAVGIGLNDFHTQTNKSFRGEIIPAHLWRHAESAILRKKKVCFQGIRLIRVFRPSFMCVLQWNSAAPGPHKSPKAFSFFCENEASITSSM